MLTKLLINGGPSILAFAVLALASEYCCRLTGWQSTDSNGEKFFEPYHTSDRDPGSLPSSPSRSDKLSPHGESWAEIIASIRPNGDIRSAKSLNLAGWKLNIVESLDVLNGLVDEVGRQRGKGEADAISWLATSLMAGGDDRSLLALAGTAICDDNQLRQILQKLEGNDNNQADRFKRDVLVQLSSHDPAGGLEWLDEFKRDYTQRSGKLGSPTLSSLSLEYSRLVVKELSRMDTASALTSLESLPDSNSSVSLRRAYLDMRVKEDPDKLWNFEIASGADRNVIRDTIDSLAKIAPSDAARRLRESKMPADITADLEKNILYHWVNQSPNNVFVALSTNRGDWRISSPMKILFNEWAARDSLEATTALATMKPGGDRDDAIQGASLYIYATNPDVAMKWIQQISSNEIRNELIQQFSGK